MDIETIKRVKGDFNQTSNTIKMNSQQSNQGTYKSQSQSEEQTERTQSLTILFNNIIDLNLKDIIALYEKIDMELFSHKFNVKILYAERNKFEDVSQLENQRIVLHLYKNTLVFAGLIIKTNQLVVIKQIQVKSQETLIQNLDEYRIHYKINKFYPQDSLELIIPVRVQKSQNFYEIAACMERAKFNLFDYSRNHQIGDEEAMNIFVQILDQIINIHSVNIAHRDIKPQNIFYVKEKGWLLSDFGESLEYENVQDSYNIRGTKYFLMPSLQLSIGKNIKLNQNLITNDTYALLVSIIMIKNQQYIHDMQEQISSPQDDLLKSIINLKNLSQLQQFRQKIKFKVNKDLINLTKSYQKDMNIEEQQLNQMFNFIFQIEYYQNQLDDTSNPTWLEQIQILIKKNLKYMLMNFNSDLGTALTQLSFKIDLKFKLNLKAIKNFKNYKPNQQLFFIQTLFMYGYTEKTVFLATEYLKTHYSQSVHMHLINSYFRANMFQEAEKQLQQFHEGMVFDQLNTNLQQNYLQLLYYQQEEQLKYNVQFDFNSEQEIIDREKQKSDDFMIEFYNEQQSLSFDPYLNREKIVDAIIKRMDQTCQDFSVLNGNFCVEILRHALNQPIYILLSLLQKAYQQNYQQFDSNKKISLLQLKAEILILLNQRKEFFQNLKILKQSSFLSESWEQTISFKILYQVIYFMEYEFQQDCKLNINLHFRKFITELRKINKLQFKCYQQYILGNLLNLIKTIQIYKIHLQSKYLVYVIQFIINLAFKYNFQITNYDDYQLFHIQAQCILIDVQNDNRCKSLVKSYRKFLNNKAQQVIQQKKLDPLNLLIRPSIKQLLRIQLRENLYSTDILNENILNTNILIVYFLFHLKAKLQLSQQNYQNLNTNKLILKTQIILQQFIIIKFYDIMKLF
ncbi:hypothetical protein pb186bvf_001760 [Paramecium bursaria]